VLVVKQTRFKALLKKMKHPTFKQIHIILVLIKCSVMFINQILKITLVIDIFQLAFFNIGYNNNVSPCETCIVYLYTTSSKLLKLKNIIIRKQ